VCVSFMNSVWHTDKKILFCSRIVGPWCILVCLLEGRPIPNFPWPIYNVAMSGCVISCSHIAKVKKLEIREKIQLMGGCYTDSLMSTNTHLITESVKSEKYLVRTFRVSCSSKICKNLLFYVVFSCF
jgi:hypothetical protein